MKTFIKNLFLLPALIAGLGVIPTARVTAQTFTNLHSLTESDGTFPSAGLLVSGNTLYGTAEYGGSAGNGTVFLINTDGTGVTNLHSFTALSDLYSGTNSDGADPYAVLIMSGNTLYGTAKGGGSAGNGTVFAVNTDGTGFTNLHSFTELMGSSPTTNTDGATPFAGLVLSGTTLFGTTVYGGGSGRGALFAVNTDGTGFTNLHSFTDLISNTNNDGALPQASLILSGNTLYGTARYGGSSGNGVVFAINTDGSSFTILYNFTAFGFTASTNSDGANPVAGLFLSGNTLYGTASQGGISGNGTVFAVNTDGSGFTNLHSFTKASSGFNPTNSDGVVPFGGLVLSGNTLFGTAVQGGSSGRGTVFAVNTNGTGFTNLHSFTAMPIDTNSDGANPRAGLVLSGNILYGMAHYGGSLGAGTVFSISLPAAPNRRPIVVNPIPDTNSIYGSAFTYTFAANSFSDPDAGQVLSYTVGGLPLGIAFDGPTRTFIGTPSNAGMYSVTVTATDNGSPPLGTNDNFYIVVNKAPLTISADNTNRPYGETNPTFTGTLVGVTNGDNLIAAFSTTATPVSPPGDYPITPTLLDPNSRLGNYTVSTNLGTFTVNGVSLEVSQSSGSLNFCWPTNAAAFVLEYTDDLAPFASWHEVTNGITTNGSTLCLIVTPEAAVPTRFYRLHLP